jgi:hypothetical protein
MRIHPLFLHPGDALALGEGWEPGDPRGCQVERAGNVLPR